MDSYYMLLIDKYRPTSLGDLDYNHNVNHFLQALAKTTDMPHLILEGYRGSGKRLRAELFLREKYGPDFAISSMDLDLDIPGKTENKPIHVLVSPYHHQINPSIHHIYDRSLLQSFISEIVEYRNLIDVPYRIIIIEDADLLSIEAQESMRRTLETCMKNCRFILLANKEDAMIAPIYSRCVRVPVASPSTSDIERILIRLNSQEGLSVPPNEIHNIANGCNRDLTRAIHFLAKYQEVKLPFNLKDYDDTYRYCCLIVDSIEKGSRLDDTMEKGVRKYLYELVNYCADCRSLIRTLLIIALERMPKSAYAERFQLCEIASQRDDSIRHSSKEIYHVESFCLHMFAIIKSIIEKQRTRAKVVVTKKTTKS